MNRGARHEIDHADPGTKELNIHCPNTSKQQNTKLVETASARRNACVGLSLDPGSFSPVAGIVRTTDRIGGQIEDCWLQAAMVHPFRPFRFQIPARRRLPHFNRHNPVHRSTLVLSMVLAFKSGSHHGTVWRTGRITGIVTR